MARIVGDTQDLPSGWEVDSDNWARRKQRKNDVPLKGLESRHAHRMFIGEDGYVYSMTAEAAQVYDRVSSN